MLWSGEPPLNLIHKKLGNNMCYLIKMLYKLLKKIDCLCLLYMYSMCLFMKKM
jgi:hypothetical protein